MQLLYQLDVSGAAQQGPSRAGPDEADPLIAELEESVERAEHDPGAEARHAAAELAVAAWRARADSDALTSKLAPQWPAYRQPPVDRAILRLALLEIHDDREPAKRAINEAVDLAKRYGSDPSPGFVNALLDKAARRWGKLGAPASEDAGTENPAQSEDDPTDRATPDAPVTGSPGAQGSPGAPPAPGVSDKAWLDDAVRDA